MTSLLKIEGIGKEFMRKLKGIGITSVEVLLEQGATPAGRKNIAEKTGIGDANVLEWVNHADLFRIKGVGEEYSDLLEEAGVDTVVELSRRVPQNLLEKMTEANQKKKLVRRLPVLSQVEDWIDQAKALPRVVNY